MDVPTSIPPALQPPVRAPLQADSETEIVVFDLETTGLDRDCQIFQLAATTRSREFCGCILPTKSMSTKAKEVTSFDVTVRGGRRVLGRRGAIVDTVSTHECLESFCDGCQQSVSLWPTTASPLTPEFCVLRQGLCWRKGGRLWRHPSPFPPGNAGGIFAQARGPSCCRYRCSAATAPFSISVLL